LIFIATATALIAGTGRAALPEVSAVDSSALDFKPWGLLAIQDGGRRKPVDTFAKETLIRVTGRSAYTDKAGRKWYPNDFVLSALLETRDWKNEPMVLISSGQLIEKLGLDKTQRRFSFAQLTGSAELQRVANEASALKRAEKPLDHIQQEALSVSDRLTLLARLMNGSALLIIPSPKKEADAWLAPDPAAAASADAPMHFWLYRVLQLGVLLLAAGTILGGVWANYSWGRFWGWDPKETWALIALLLISASVLIGCGTACEHSIRRFIRRRDSYASNISTTILKDFTVQSGVMGSRS